MIGASPPLRQKKLVSDQALLNLMSDPPEFLIVLYSLPSGFAATPSSLLDLNLTVSIRMEEIRTQVLRKVLCEELPNVLVESDLITCRGIPRANKLLDKFIPLENSFFILRICIVDKPQDPVSGRMIMFITIIHNFF